MSGVKQEDWGPTKRIPPPSKRMMSTHRLATLGFLLTLAAAASGLRCWRCGTYSDGVGSITPCANRSATKLEECPKEAKQCIKYVSELTIVRDCVPTCSEKEWWGARTFCCDTDECNAAFTRAPAVAAIIAAALITLHYAR